MGIIDVTVTNSNKTDNWLNNLLKDDYFDILDSYAREGVRALSNATPTETGKTAESWSYEIVRRPGRHAIIFHNSNVHEGKPIAILIQYGHGVHGGGFVQGRDYINPVILPLFDKIVADVWKAVNK